MEKISIRGRMSIRWAWFLYELLVGALPLDYRKLAFHEVLRKLREEDAPKPSKKLQSTPGEDSTLIAKRRRTEPVALSRQLKGDLDSITLKTLEKERSRRYGAPSELAFDIRRYLNNEPVTVASMDTLAAILIKKEKFTEAEEILRERFDAQPGFAGADDRKTLMAAISNHGTSSAAESFFRKMLEIEKQASGVEDEVTFTTMESLGWTLDEEHRYGEAETIFRELSQIERRLLGPQDRKTKNSTYGVIRELCLADRTEEAERYVNDLGGMDANFSRDMKLYISRFLDHAAVEASRKGRPDEARKPLRRAFGIDASTHSDSGFAWTWYSSAEGDASAGRADEAIKSVRAAIGYGFNDADQLTDDESFIPLRRDPRFEALVAQLRRGTKERSALR